MRRGSKGQSEQLTRLRRLGGIEPAEAYKAVANQDCAASVQQATRELVSWSDKEKAMEIWSYFLGRV